MLSEGAELSAIDGLTDYIMLGLMDGPNVGSTLGLTLGGEDGPSLL